MSTPSNASETIDPADIALVEEVMQRVGTDARDRAWQAWRRIEDVIRRRPAPAAEEGKASPNPHVLQSADEVLGRLAEAPESRTYKPWTFETMPVAVKVRHKDFGRHPNKLTTAWPYDEKHASCRFGAFTYEDMLESFEQIDGTPCGKLVVVPTAG